MVCQGNLLGHIVSRDGISTNFDKIKVIVDFPRPRTPKDVKKFMGHNGYYCSFVCMYAMIAKLLYGLLVVFIWTEEYEESLKLKTALSTHPSSRHQIGTYSSMYMWITLNLLLELYLPN